MSVADDWSYRHRGQVAAAQRQFERRGLLQSSMPVEVSTPSELADAVADDKAVDIVVINHLDLTVLELKSTGICPAGCESPLGAISTTRSIRGDCSGVPTTELPSIPPPELAPLLPGQCILLGQEDLLAIVAPDFWLDNLYLRALFVNVQEGAKRAEKFVALAAVPPINGTRAGTATRYMTRMTFQGDNAGPTVGVWGDEKVYVEDSSFLHLGGSQASYCPDCSAAVNSRATAVSLNSCTFQSPFGSSGRYIRAYEAGAVRVENCTFAEATNPFEARASSSFYSDDPTLQVEGVNQRFAAPTPLEDIPEPSAGAAPLFLSRDDQWFAELRNELTGEPLPPPAEMKVPAELAEPPDSSTVAQESPISPDTIVSQRGISPGRHSTSSGSSSGSQLLAIILGAAGVLTFAILAVVLTLVILKRRKRKKHQSTEATKASTTAHAQSVSSYPQSYPQSVGSYAQSYGGGPPPGSIHSMQDGSMTEYGTPQIMKLQSLQPQSMSTANEPFPKALSQNGSGWGKDSLGNMGAGTAMYSSIPSSMRGPGSQQSQPGATRGSSPGYDPASNFYPNTNTEDTFTATKDPNQPSEMSTLGIVGSTLMPPGKDAPIVDRLDFLHSQLDTVGVDKPIMRRFKLLGHAHRRQGGQGLVAFARGMNDQLDYAIKFFLVQESFEAERSLYKTKALGALLPQVEAEYDPAKADTKLRDSRGTPLPPFIVMEKGESLSDWTQRSHPELFQGIAVLVHVATRLRDMHAAGYVHRDIKPGNIMLLPRKNSWTVIDFGCTARTGEQAPLSFTVQYCPPEVMEAYLAKERSIIATEAMDAWAMGVVAFELLTGGNAFSFVTGSKQIIDQLQGKKELPWEGEQHSEARKKLGIFRQPILSLLHREPTERATLAAFCNSCQQIFSSTSTENGLMPM